METPKHGEIPAGEVNRWCEVHGWHGPLYACLEYPAAVLAEIENETARWRRKLDDPESCNEMIRQGLPPEGVMFFRMFAGLE